MSGERTPKDYIIAFIAGLLASTTERDGARQNDVTEWIFRIQAAKTDDELKNAVNAGPSWMTWLPSKASGELNHYLGYERGHPDGEEQT